MQQEKQCFLNKVFENSPDLKKIEVDYILQQDVSIHS